MNGAWHSESAYPIERTVFRELYLGAGTLEAPESGVSSPESGVDEQAPGVEAEFLNSQFLILDSVDHYPHRPTHGTRGSLSWGAGGEPNGLARDLRLDEAMIPTYTSAPLAEPLDVIGFPEAVLFLSSSAPVAHVVVRLNDVAPDGTSRRRSAPAS